MNYRKRPDHFNPYLAINATNDTYYRSEKFKELIELKRNYDKNVNGSQAMGDQDIFEYYKSSYDGSTRAILPYLRKDYFEDKDGEEQK